MKKEIYEAYETIKPEDTAKERMLANIRKAASETQDVGKDMSMKKWYTAHKLQFAAAMAVVLILPAAAYATDLFGLQSRSIGKSTVEEMVPEGQNGTMEKTEREVDLISLEGMADSPEAQACAEWAAFYDEYDKDGTILDEIGNGPTGIDTKYDVYTCYTQEMADKVDEICKKYKLSLLTGQTVAETYDELIHAAGVGDICGNVSNGVYFSTTGGSFYDDGSFSFEGEAIVPNETSAYMTDYQFICSKKGTFCPYYLNVENIDAYEQWEYTTARGENVFLANSDSKALIIVDTKESCMVVNLLGDILSGTFELDNQTLETIADAFDFSLVDESINL